MALIAIAGYVVLQMLVAAFVARGTRSDDDYLLAGRRLGVTAVAMSLFATWFAAESVVATTAEVADKGLAGARVEPFAYGLGILVLGLFVAGRLRRGGYVTVAGFMGERFGGQAEGLSAVIIAVSAIVWAAAQLFALATLIAAAGEMSFLTALTAATAVVMLYTLVGGLAGDVATDVIQGVILTVGVGALLYLAVEMIGGPQAALAAIPAERLRVALPGESWLDRAELWLIPVVGSITAQEAISRTLGAQSPEVARKGAILGSGIYVLVGLMPVALGFVGPHLGVALGRGDEFAPSLAHALLPGWLYVVFVGALLSAILSSVDSALLSVSAVVTESGYRRVRPDMGPRESLVAARVATLAAGLAAFAIAAAGPGLRELVLASSAIAGAYVVAMLIGMSTSVGGPLAGTASVLVAASLLALLTWVRPVQGGFLLAIGGSLVAYLAIAAREHRGSLGR